MSGSVDEPNNGRWIERTIIGSVLALLAGAILYLYVRSLESSQWRGMIQERIDNVASTLERIDRKLDSVP